ncbi:MAG: hypothetical protein ACRCYY_17585 [Trueperaceae bacterium]
MNVSTHIIKPEVALRELERYQAIPPSKRSQDDEAFIRLYKSAAKGQRIVNVQDAFKETGLNDLGQPKLALARSVWKDVWFERTYQWRDGKSVSNGGGQFLCVQSSWQLQKNHTSKYLNIPQGTFEPIVTNKTLHSPVPHVPPGLRPKQGLGTTFILFEVEKWNEYPADPFLLRHIQGWLYLVLAEWDLTPLEVSLLSSMRTV